MLHQKEPRARRTFRRSQRTCASLNQPPPPDGNVSVASITEGAPVSFVMLTTQFLSRFSPTTDWVNWEICSAVPARSETFQRLVLGPGCRSHAHSNLVLTRTARNASPHLRWARIPPSLLTRSEMHPIPFLRKTEGRPGRPELLHRPQPSQLSTADRASNPSAGPPPDQGPTG